MCSGDTNPTLHSVMMSDTHRHDTILYVRSAGHSSFPITHPLCVFIVWWCLDLGLGLPVPVPLSPMAGTGIGNSNGIGLEGHCWDDVSELPVEM